MGCRLTRTAQTTLSGENSGTTTASAAAPQPDAAMSSARDFKTRLERLMCIARETPEPVFELSGCDLKAVPAGVFILCKVLRKERLDLRANRLRSLADGGALRDLVLLTHLDLSANAFQKLPDELTELINLRELHIQNNRLTQLPAQLSKLHRIEFLDCSRNQLTDIRSINCMFSLRILNVSGNASLALLPMELSTCGALVDIICDANTIRDPPGHVLERGTPAILQYLMGNVEAWRDCERPARVHVELAEEAAEVEQQVQQTISRHSFDASDGADDIFDEFSKQLQIDQQRNREDLLQQLMKQQHDSDALVSELQLKRDAERNKLIDDIASAEATSSVAVDRLLSLRNGAFAADVQRTAEQEQFALLDRLRVQHADVQHNKVLHEMSEQLSREHERIAANEERRDLEHGQLLRHIETDDRRLNDAVGLSDEARGAAVERIRNDEQLQRAAVAALMDRGDGQSWALVEQVRLIEGELVRMTREELQRRKSCANDQMNKLAEQRMDLSSLLAELMDQQDRRKRDLLASLQHLESEQQVKQQDFWLLQYQKLLDVRGADDATGAAAALDPLLGYQLLTHGVIHLLPLLARLLRRAKCDGDLRAIDEHGLKVAGIRSAADRRSILRAIEAYCEAAAAAMESCESCSAPSMEPSAPPETCASIGVDETSAEPGVEPNATATATAVTVPENNTIDGVAECVVCMEIPSKIVFLPCGHLCCCVSCQESLTLCPMCRTRIERRIKVIQA